MARYSPDFILGSLNIQSALTFSDSKIIDIISKNISENTVKNIINARKMHNISMKDLANISGVPYSTIRRIEEFKVLPNMTDYLKICATLGIDTNCVTK